jgi:ABC-type uncharacterized transport system substrate-binding protein
LSQPNLDADNAGALPVRQRGCSACEKLVALQPDVILAHTTQVTVTLQQESRALPIVFVNVSDPIGSGFIASLGHLPDGQQDTSLASRLRPTRSIGSPTIPRLGWKNADSH